jgi:hypothetical protein
MEATPSASRPHLRRGFGAHPEHAAASTRPPGAAPPNAPFPVYTPRRALPARRNRRSYCDLWFFRRRVASMRPMKDSGAWIFKGFRAGRTHLVHADPSWCSTRGVHHDPSFPPKFPPLQTFVAGLQTDGAGHRACTAPRPSRSTSVRPAAYASRGGEARSTAGSSESAAASFRVAPGAPVAPAREAARSRNPLARPEGGAETPEIP